MELYFNQNNEMDVKKINNEVQVIDFINAIRDFLKKNPLDCFNCKDNCCSRGWNIELDIVFYNRLIDEDIPYLENYRGEVNSIFEINSLNRPVFKDSTCFFLNKKGKCRIYEKRPFICRGYTCYQEAENYKILRDTILDSLNLTFYIKLLAEKENKTVSKIAFNKFEIKQYKLLPFKRKDYSIKILNLIEGIKPILTNNKYKELENLFE
ncbi:MAG: YkgJ family cysteine cluster protein [Bacillota bacterium]